MNLITNNQKIKHEMCIQKMIIIKNFTHNRFYVFFHHAKQRQKHKTVWLFITKQIKLTNVSLFEILSKFFQDKSNMKNFTADSIEFEK